MIIFKNKDLKTKITDSLNKLYNLEYSPQISYNIVKLKRSIEEIIKDNLIVFNKIQNKQNDVTQGEYNELIDEFLNIEHKIDIPKIKITDIKSKNMSPIIFEDFYFLFEE